MLHFPEEYVTMYARTKPAYKKVYNILKATILSGQVSAMEHLTESAVAEALELSRTPVRAALAQLKSEGILDQVSKNGVGVKQLSKNDKASLLYLDEILESTAAALAAATATEEDIDTLAEINDTLREFSPEKWCDNLDAAAIRDLHLQFHTLIAKMSGNRYLYKAIVELRSIMRMHRNDDICRLSAYPEEIAPCHDHLLRAFYNHDVEGARMWMQVDIHSAREVYLTSRIV